MGEYVMFTFSLAKFSVLGESLLHSIPETTCGHFDISGSIWGSSESVTIDICIWDYGSN